MRAAPAPAPPLAPPPAGSTARSAAMWCISRAFACIYAALSAKILPVGVGKMLDRQQEFRVQAWQPFSSLLI